MDGIGKSGAAVDYHFALLNLQRHDGVVPMNHIDQMLQKMVGPVLKQEEFADFWGQQEAAMRQAQIQAYFAEVERQEREARDYSQRQGAGGAAPWTQIRHFEGSGGVPGQQVSGRDEPPMVARDFTEGGVSDEGAGAEESLRGLDAPGAAREWSEGAFTFPRWHQQKVPVYRDGKIVGHNVVGQEDLESRLYGGGIYGVQAREGEWVGGGHLEQRVVAEAADNPRMQGRTWPRILNTATAFDDGRPSQGFEDTNSWLMGHGSPLHGDYDYDNPIPGTLPPWVELLRDFYLHPVAHGLTQSQIDHEKDRRWEQFHREHPDYNELGARVKIGHPIVDAWDGASNYLGKSNMTPHDMYERHYDEWLADNDILNSFHSDDADGERKLRETHMNQAIENWLKIGQMDEEGHPIGMGLGDYFYGLEWLSPKERSAVYDHRRVHGTDDHNHQRVKDARGFEMGRLKRNKWNRFQPLYEHFGREPDMPGIFGEHNLIPVKQDKAKPQHIREALKEGSLDQEIIRHHYAQTGEEDGDVGRGIPKMGKVIEDRFAGEDGVVSLKQLLRLAGIDHNTLGRGKDRYSNLEFYKKGEHPDYPNWDPDTAPITKAGQQGDIRKDIRRIMNQANRLSNDNYHARKMNNAGAFHLNQRVNPNQYVKGKVPNDHFNYAGYKHPETGEYIPENSTLSTHWGRPFRHHGGTGRHHNIALDIIHQHTGERVEDKEGNPTGEIHSLMGISSDVASTEGMSDERIAALKLLPFHANFDLADKSIGAMGPFSPAFGSEREREKKKKYERTDPDDPMSRRLVGEELGGLKYKSPSRPEVFNQWNTKVMSQVKGGKSDITRFGTHTSMPASNHMIQELFQHYMDEKQREAALNGIRKGRIEGKSSHLNIRLPHRGQSELFGPSHHEKNVDDISKRRAAQMGWTNHPLNPAPSYVDHNALTPEHTKHIGSLQSMKEGMGTGQAEPSGEFGTTYSEDREAAELELDMLDQKLLNAEHQLEKDFPDIRNRIKRNEATPEEVQGWLKRSGEFKDIRRQIHDAEEAMDDVDTLPDRTENEYKYPLQSHDAKHKRDTEVIGDEAADMRQRWEQATGQSAFDPNDLWTSICNAMEFARKSNTYLNMKDPSEHGRTSLSMDFKERPTDVVTGGERQANIKSHVHDNGNLLTSASSDEEFYEALGLDPEDYHHSQTIAHVKDRLHHLSNGDTSKQFNLMTKNQLLKQTDFPDEESLFDQITDARGRAREHKGRYRIDGEDWKSAAPAMNALSSLKRTLSDPEVLSKLGLHIAQAHHRHPRGADDPHSKVKTGGTHTTGKGRTEAPGLHGKQRSKKKKLSPGEKANIARDNSLQLLESVLISDPEIESQQIGQSQKKDVHWAESPIGGGQHALHSIFDSHGDRINWGWKARPTAHVELSHTGKDSYHHTPEGRERRLLPLTRDMIAKVMPELLPYLGSHHPEVEDTLPQVLRPDIMGRVPIRGDMGARILTNSDGPTLLASLTNPDVLLKIDAEKPPSIQPMHRIFELDDLEHLRGFTGDWMVTLMPEGKRHFVRRKDDDIESWSTTSGKVSISEDDQKSFKKTTEKDFLIDVIQVDDEYHVFDILEFDDKDIHDLPIQERMKVLRGGMESHEKVMLPAAYNTRLADDAGLESAVKDLQKEGKRILLRDAKSTYMAGEQRHPKWVLLAPGNDVNLIVLERRGEDPYSYRLGTGPITQEEKMGERGVELDGETYMDVGTVFSSPKKYEVGDHVEVNVDSVTSHQSDDETIYTIHAGSIEDEAEGEALVSRDTLEVMTKSEPTNWPHEVRRTDRHVTIRFPLGRIIYKATSRGEQWMVHSPEAENSLLIRMAESQRPFWAPVAGMMLKGNLDMVEEEHKEEVHESKGDGKPLIPPKKVKDTGHWKKVVQGLEAIEKTIGSVGQAFSGTRGLGIDYATPIQSPTGPTENKDQSALPDYDARKLPEEDPEEPYEKRKDKPQSIDLPVESEGEQGLLHVDDDTATLHIV